MSQFKVVYSNEKGQEIKAGIQFLLFDTVNDLLMLINTLFDSKTMTELKSKSTALKYSNLREALINNLGLNFTPNFMDAYSMGKAEKVDEVLKNNEKAIIDAYNIISRFFIHKGDEPQISEFANDYIKGFETASVGVKDGRMLKELTAEAKQMTEFIITDIKHSYLKILTLCYVLKILNSNDANQEAYKDLFNTTELYTIMTAFINYFDMSNADLIYTLEQVISFTTFKDGCFEITSAGDEIMNEALHTVTKMSN